MASILVTEKIEKDRRNQGGAGRVGLDFVVKIEYNPQMNTSFGHD